MLNLTKVKSNIDEAWLFIWTVAKTSFVIMGLLVATFKFWWWVFS